MRQAINIDEALKNSNSQTYKQADIKNKKPKKSIISVYLEDDEFEYIKQKSKEDMTSMTVFIRKLIKKSMQESVL